MGSPINAVYVSEQGIDYRALIGTFLDGALHVSQGLDDYLDSDLESRGLNSSNFRRGNTLFSSLEHQWDEGFGYFGAARDFGARSASQNSGDPLQRLRPFVAFDSNEDGAIDLQSEASFGAAVLAARRDSESVTPTDLSESTFRALIEGRTLIHQYAGQDLPPGVQSQLLVIRDVIALNWEKTIAATLVASLNRLLRHYQAFIDGSPLGFEAFAEDWSRAKGHLLALQFFPRPQLALESQGTLHELLGVQPAVPGATMTPLPEVMEALRQVRASLATAYGFAPANVGNADGQGGWGR